MPAPLKRRRFDVSALHPGDELADMSASVEDLHEELEM